MAKTRMGSMDRRILGEGMRRLREQAKLTAPAAAKAVGIQPNALYQIERGDKQGIDTVLALVQLYTERRGVWGALLEAATIVGPLTVDDLPEPRAVGRPRGG